VQDLKISLVTVCYNAESTISRTIESVIAQNFKNVEYIIIDGGSTDNTIQYIIQYKNHVSIFLSEPDKGIYDAMNKGINLATGDITGTLNADDYFASNDVLQSVAAAFVQHEPEIVYGDLDYVNEEGRVIRKWRSRQYFYGMFNWGWMPPHPTFYCRRNLFEQYGCYSLGLGSAADYELMLRFIHVNKLKAVYINKVLVKMNIGGVSNKNMANRLRALFFDLKAMRNNDILLPIVTLVFKPLRKITQYFSGR
jgi:glycosyltransferase involved in cell wall biosynthesis